MPGKSKVDVETFKELYCEEVGFCDLPKVSSP